MVRSGCAARRQPGVERHQHAPQQRGEQIDGAPLGLVDHHAAAKRRKGCAHALEHHVRHAVAPAQGEHRGDVAQRVHQRRGQTALGLAFAQRVLHDAAIETADQEAQDDVTADRDDADHRRDQPQGDDRPEQPDRVLQVDVLALGKAVQRAGRLVDAAHRLGRVTRLVPGQRRIEHATRQRCEHHLAHPHGRVALEHPAGAVHRPARRRRREHAGQQQAGVRQAGQPAALDLVDRLAGQPGHGQLEQLRTDQQCKGAQQHAACPGCIAPELAVEVEYALRAVEFLVHVFDL